MRYVEHRRHSMRHRPGEHLTQAGVSLARRVGEGMGPFRRVVTSPAPRAFQTAIAMGFAVDEVSRELAMMPDGIEAEVDWQEGCAAFQRAVGRGGITAGYARRLAEYLRALAAGLPEGGSALVVSHGGIVEAGAVGALPDFDYRPWGPSASYCEGVRLHFQGARFVHAELLRVPPPPEPLPAARATGPQAPGG